MEEAIERLEQIQNEIEALIQEGIRLAEENKVTFELGSTTFAHEYGMGGYRYVPEDSEEAEERRKYGYYDEYEISGWLTSSSECS